MLKQFVISMYSCKNVRKLTAKNGWPQNNKYILKTYRNQEVYLSLGHFVLLFEFQRILRKIVKILVSNHNL